MDLKRPFEITQFIRQAIEASAYAAPDDHGLSLEELCTLGTQLGFGRGEVSDALQGSQIEWRYSKGKYLLPADRFRADFVSEGLEPDPRNVHRGAVADGRGRDDRRVQAPTKMRDRHVRHYAWRVARRTLKKSAGDQAPAYRTTRREP